MRFLSRKTARRTGAATLAVMVISAGFMGALGGAFGPDAQDVAEQVSPVGESEALLPALIVAGTLSGAAVCYLNDCDVTQEDLDRVESMEDAQQMADLHAGLIGQRETSISFLTSMGNFVEDSRAVASMKAKAKMVELLNQGITNSTLIEQEVDQVIADYYTVRQRNIVARFNQHMAQVSYAIETIKNDSGIAGDFVDVPDNQDSDTEESGSGGSNTLSWNGWQQQTAEIYTLSNGTVVNTTAWTADLDDSFDGDSGSYRIGLVGESGSGTDGYGTSLAPPSHLIVKKVTDPSLSSSENASRQAVIHFDKYHTLLQNLASNATSLQNNYDQTFISTVVSSYEQGSVNTTDLVTPEMLASEWATELNATGASTYKWANLAALGLESPDLENVSYMTVRHFSRVPQRHVTVNATGDLSEDGLTVYVRGGPEHIGDRNYSLASGIGPVDSELRIPVAEGETLHFQTGAGTWTNFTNRPDQFTPYVAEGESKTITGVTLSIEDGAFRDWRTEHGMLFARDAPAGGFQVNTTYSVDALGTSVYFAERGTNTSLEKVVGNFTITYAENDDGSSLEAIDVHRYNYQTYNASALEEQLTQLQELRQLIESREVVAGGGGGFTIPDLGLGGLGSLGGIALLAAAGAVLLLGRD